MLLKVPEIDVNAVTPKSSALHIAAKNGRLALVQLLVMSQPDLQYSIFNIYMYKQSHSN